MLAAHRSSQWGQARLGLIDQIAVAVVAVAVLVGSVAVAVPAAPAGAAASSPTGGGAADQPAPPSHGAVPTLPKSAGYVHQLYTTLLDRPPGRNETLYVGVLVDGFGPRPPVQGMTSGPEFLGRVVDAAYMRLGRAADDEGRGYWIERLQSDLTIELLDLFFLGGDEYDARAGNNIALVDALYEDLFGRAPDPGGRAYWTAQLETGTPRIEVVFRLIFSAEHANRVVSARYRQVLDRPVDSGAAPYWRDEYLSGRVGELELTRLLAASTEATDQGCDPLVGRSCLLPFPNDYFTVPDPGTVTGKRVAFRPSMMPENSSGVGVDPRPSNRSDGFAAGQSPLLFVPGIDLAQTGAVPITDIARSFDPDAPVVVIDAETGERHPIWVELDSNAPPSGRPGNQLLYIRAAKNWTAGHRYIVALRDLRDGSGAVIPAPDTFARYRDQQPEPGDVGGFERRRPHMEQIFGELAAGGIARDDLYLAWDFTVASTENVTGRMLHLRDDGFGRLGSAAPTFAVTEVTPNPRPGVVRRIQGTFRVPSYLTQDGPGGVFTQGPDGLPVYSGRDLTTTFTCIVPTAALTTPGRPVVYGHGLFGGQDEVNGEGMVPSFGMVYCATDWLGMAAADLPTAVSILQDMSVFPRLADRVQQGVLSFLFLARLMRHADGFASDPAFQNGGGQPVIDTTEVFFDGNSQGGILGAIATAVSNEWERAVLGVPGMNYSVLVERSVDFDPFNAVFTSTYPDVIDRVILLQVIQMQWDRADPVGYAAHLTGDPLHGTQPHKVLLHVALGDHQVAQVTAENETRTADIPAHQPALAPGRSDDATPLWGIDAIPSNRFDGSGLIYWDSGAPLPPTTNTPPREGEDPHGDPRHAPAARSQKSEFLRTGGAVVDTCNDQPCTAPAR